MVLLCRGKIVQNEGYRTTQSLRMLVEFADNGFVLRRMAEENAELAGLVMGVSPDPWMFQYYTADFVQ